MKVSKAVIHNFKSIAKDCLLQVDRNVTTLVGANNSGRTNVLLALEKFTTGNHQPDDVCSFSLEGQVAQPNPDLPMISVTFDIEEGDREALTNISPMLGAIGEFTVVRKYSSALSIEGIESLEGYLADIMGQLKKTNVDVRRFLDSCRKEWVDIDEQLNMASKAVDDFDSVLVSAAKGKTVAQKPHLTEELASLLNSLSSLREKFTSESERSEGEGEPPKGKVEAETASQLVSELQSLAEQYESMHYEKIASEVSPLLPKFIYVSAVPENLLKGQVSLDELETAPEDDTRFMSVRRLIRLADLNLAELKVVSPVQRRSRLKHASNRLTELLHRIWEQEKITITLVTTGANNRELQIWIGVDDGEDRLPESQGYGFRWYLEFYLAYAAASGRELGHDVLLLDEAGVYLHPLAQRNLVERLKEIAENNQIIHTTHSSDMLDFDYPDRWRVVTKDEAHSIGTQIINEAYQPKGDHIGFEVIMKALWGSMVPYLIPGPKNLIVEGPADVVELRAISRILGKEDEADAMLVSEQIATLPAHGLSNYRKALIFCTRPGFNTVALFDSDDAGRRTKHQLIADGTLLPQKAVEINDVYPESQRERDLENLFGFILYREAALRVYGSYLPADFKLKREDLPRKGGLGRRFKDFFESQGVEQYDKPSVAEALRDILIENPSKLPEKNREKFRTLLVKVRESFQSQ